MERETRLFGRMLSGLLRLAGIGIFGIGDLERLDRRTPNACFNLAGVAPGEVAERKGRESFMTILIGDHANPPFRSMEAPVM